MIFLNDLDNFEIFLNGEIWYEIIFKGKSREFETQIISVVNDRYGKAVSILLS